ncbi:bifunctional DNA primase/polymerase [Dictyobacter arantiisoli]|uniref:DNA primase/polymerase bifunctional N-terminal domain-containing protein n=1 Tax=Dictyobacter arantiisoli TaxID=2014874 RepID=A0A5A5THW9_9CHLR|nr:bifunctional DNA primase/polymerase [Dictyobacter arantiisoli]GCF10736.1 hypothetical protein KDI_43000 [Dictyobacter arantiisoli]
MRQITRAIQTTYPSVCRLQDAAYDYARQGWRVLPLHGLITNASGILACTCAQIACAKAGQHPLGAMDIQRATSDLATLQTWWRQDEDANIGIVTGDGLLVIEIDSLRGGSLTQFKQLYAIPETAWTRIPDGRWQLYFIYNRALSLHSTRNKLGPGIVTYGEGSYAVAPPSRLPHGTAHWQDDSSPAHLPAVLLPFMLDSKIIGPAWLQTEQQPSTAADELAQLLARRPLLWSPDDYEKRS